MKSFAAKHNREYNVYYAEDYRLQERVDNSYLQNYLYDLHTGQTDQMMGALPLVEGMPVIFTYNYDVAGGIVNGTEGTVKQVNYRIAADGKRYAKSCVIAVNDVSCPTLPNLQPREVVALLETVTFTIRNPVTKANITITCKQLPILPAFAMTNYKSQGKTLPCAILDLESCPLLYSLYIMLSRVKSLKVSLSFAPLIRRGYIHDQRTLLISKQKTSVSDTYAIVQC